MVMTSCHNPKDDSAIAMPVQRLDTYALMHSDIDSLKEEMRPTMATYLHMMGYGAALTDSALLQLHNSQTIQVFGRDIAAKFGSRDTLDGLYPSLLDSINTLCNSHIKCMATIASPYMQSVILSDSTIFIALNHYLGADYDGYSSMPEFIRKNKHPEQIKYDVTEAILRISYTYEKTEGTLLEQILYEGAIAHAISHLTGEAYNDVLGISPDEYRLVTASMHEIWQRLATENLLYSQRSADISRIIEPSPFVAINGLQLPGQVGKLIGANIIDRYMAGHPSTSIIDILSPEFYGHSQRRLIDAHFTP